MKYIMLHGLGQTSSIWEKVKEGLDEHQDILCPELFQMTENMTYPQVYRAFEQYCEQFHEPLHLCGLSLGGIMVLHYAIENPDKVESLILIGTQYVMPRKLLWFQNLLFRCIPNKSFQKMGVEKKNMIKLSASMINLDFEKDLSKILCPVLVICGEQDKVNMRACQKLAELLPNARFKTISQAGHEVNRDQPQALAQLIKEFYQ
ncbi:MAG: alpha/beta hydrolase [Lachnospiraceae bacterium]|nr:alpha/beta hydrolase [Lachnospiraceae bacterium]